MGHWRLLSLAILSMPLLVECGGRVSTTKSPGAGSGGVGGGTGGTFPTGGTGGMFTTGGTGGTFMTGGTGGTFATGGTGGTFTTGGTGGTGGFNGVTGLGKACATNVDCDPGLRCLTPDSNINGGGPGGGYCTKSCTTNTDCQALDPNAQCDTLVTQAQSATLYCHEGCTPGGSTTTPDPNKCHGRVNDGEGPVACAQIYASGADGGIIGSGTSVCEPLCGSNADCGDKKCDLSTGFCDSNPKTGDPIGTPCNPQAATDPCAGVCIGEDPNNNTKGECSALCTSGTISCGYVLGQKASAACLFVFAQVAGLGDLGACGQLCDCNSDCLNPGDICNSLAGTGYDTATGRAGVCAPPSGNAGITTCP